MGTTKVLVTGVTGMLGHTLFTRLSQCANLDVYATARSATGLSGWFQPELLKKVLVNVDADNFDNIIRAIASVRPDVVINCIGIIKQAPAAKDPLAAIAVNALLPHRIASLCKVAGARLIHISTDCVFSGAKGNYIESDPVDAADLYGKTKHLGEVAESHCVTLRTSIIGHEIKGKYGLIEWFMAKDEKIRGFTKAVFSGFPTVEIARIINDYVIPGTQLTGLYHVSSAPISKYELLKSVAKKYGKSIEILPDDNFCINRALDSTKFRRASGYIPPSWPELIDNMYRDYITAPHYKEQ
ncbi:dTDP-4-dehydrorhamnose reductase family protein [Phosphitispora fastidiosa]|uniref:dTDP-4-dehydrorhamnose reductase family protein n=1 Tax=Phosphitispora fastidiosa TaxID=2837202 RepID=UPI001E4929F5|nr:SDR family oxidoreductase [Phosphitispora fastidiosa]MBU7008571.1 dTDP-4-dehydrorhamnose reductase [Phosphitispora fastidiosa]